MADYPSRQEREILEKCGWTDVLVGEVNESLAGHSIEQLCCSSRLGSGLSVPFHVSRFLQGPDSRAQTFALLSSLGVDGFRTFSSWYPTTEH